MTHPWQRRPNPYRPASVSWRRHWRRVLFLVAIVAGLGVYQAVDDDEPERPSATVAGGGETLRGRVTGVADGDTINVVLGGGREERVRYIGIDTPETEKPDAGAECFADEAAEANRDLVQGREVELRLDAEARDRFGRLLAYVYRLPDRLLIQAELLRGGFAKTLEVPPNTRFAGIFADAEYFAGATRRGLWATCE